MAETSAPMPVKHNRWVGRALVLSIFLAASALAVALMIFRAQNREGINDGSPVGRARADILFLQSQLRSYVRVTGNYPAEAEGLDALVKVRVLKGIPTDPWGRPYVYRLVAGTGRVLSFGRDGVEGGTGEDADIDSSFRNAAGREAAAQNASPDETEPAAPRELAPTPSGDSR